MWSVRRLKGVLHNLIAKTVHKTAQSLLIQMAQTALLSAFVATCLPTSYVSKRDHDFKTISMTDAFESLETANDARSKRVDATPKNTIQAAKSFDWQNRRSKGP